MKKFVNPFLMIPGPTPVPHEVALAAAKDMIGHRSGAFKASMKDLTEKLKQLFETKQDVVLLTSSGTGGMEAAVCGSFSKGDKVLVASVGNFGKRWEKIAKAYGLDVVLLEYYPGQSVDPSAVKAILTKDSEKKIKGILFQMNETSTAVLNDVEEIAKVANAHGCLVIVDSISGFLTAPLKFDEWGIDIAIAGSQKAFMIPPGLAVVAVSTKAYEAFQKSDLPKFYFDLKAAVDQSRDGQTPWTPAIGLVNSLIASVNILMAEGLVSVMARHEFLMKAVRAAVRSMGLKLLNEDDNTASRAVTAIKAPAGIDAEDIRKIMREEYGITLAGGQGDLKGKIFRVGHLGLIDIKEIIAMIACLEITLTKLGVDIKWGQGVQAVQDVIIKY